MLRAALWTLRQRRYTSLTALMVVLAIGCVGAGTWQVARFRQSVRDNNALRANARSASVELTPDLVPLVGHGHTPGRLAVDYRTVTVTGHYLAGADQFVRDVSMGDQVGYYVLHALRAGAGVLLVVRGFVADSAAGTPPTSITPPPAGAVRVRGRLQSAATAPDDSAALVHRELESINPADQAARSGQPVYDAYLTLDPRQPGTAGVQPVSAPDLTNPAGGAYEWQHFAYILQWYAFALLALAAPFIIGRSEIRDAQRRFLGIDPARAQFDLDPARSATPAALSAPAPRALALRSGATIDVTEQPSRERWRRAAALADRYGRSLGSEPPPGPGLPPPSTRAPRPEPSVDVDADVDGRARVRGGLANSALAPHRSGDDGYHGAYNDYLWQLALADGNIPPVDPGPARPARDPGEPDPIR